MHGQFFTASRFASTASIVASCAIALVACSGGLAGTPMGAPGGASSAASSGELAGAPSVGSSAMASSAERPMVVAPEPSSATLTTPTAEAGVPPQSGLADWQIQSTGGQQGRAGGALGEPGDQLELGAMFIPNGATSTRAFVKCLVHFTIQASNPGWSNSPYNFTAKVLFNGTVVGQVAVADPNNVPRSSEVPGTVECGNAVAPIGSTGIARLVFEVDGNWTARPKMSNNPADRVRLGVVAALVHFE